MPGKRQAEMTGKRQTEITGKRQAGRLAEMTGKRQVGCRQKNDWEEAGRDDREEAGWEAGRDD